MSDIGLISSMSDISSTSKKWRLMLKHDRSECLQCSRSRNSRVNSRINSDLNISGPRRKVYQSSNVTFDVSYNSPESVFSEESVADRASGQIMRHIQRLANPVWSKQSKNALLELKNKHPQAFQDICLYSEVCRTLGRNTYRPNARRFIQEVFYDLDFDTFNNEPNEILVHKENFDRDETLEIIECDDSLKAFSGELDVILMSGCQPQQSSLNHNVSGSSSFNTNLISGQSAFSQSTPTTNTIVKSHLMHFKTPALESVYEASSENLLSESVNSKKSSKLMLVPTQNIISNNNNTMGIVGDSDKLVSSSTTHLEHMEHVSDTASSVASSTDHVPIRRRSTIVTETANSSNLNTLKHNSNSSSSVSSNRPNYMRPRFNTLELDLSCTKNKFPIRDRSKIHLTTKLNTVTIRDEDDVISSTSPNSGRLLTSNLSTIITRAPLGSLYCEKRLKSSQSEHTLTEHQRNKKQ